MVRAGTGGLLYPKRGNYGFTLLASAARTATTDSAIQTNATSKGITLYLRITTAVGGQTLTLSVIFRDPLNAATGANLLTHASLSGTGVFTFQIYPGITTGSTVRYTTVSAVLDLDWFLRITPTDASSWTYSVYGVYID